MSKSYRKPYIRDCYKSAKDIANRTIRQRMKAIDYSVNPSYYKRMYDRYDIYDYNIYFPDDKRNWRK